MTDPTPLWQRIDNAVANHRDVVVDLKPAVYAAIIRAVADGMVLDTDFRTGTPAMAVLRWLNKQADRAERGE